MSKVAHYLQEHLMGEVIASPDVRRLLAHDASVLRQVPAMAVYPRDENDVRKTARFCWQLAERGKVVPITARGSGSDTSGAALGSGIIMLFTAHMNRLLSLDPRKKTITVEPGVVYDKLEQTLHTHGLFLPPYPASSAYATLGGGLANNALGEKTIKYGDTRKYVRGLRVALANGELIETEPLGKRELSQKMGLSTMEGRIYRELDALLEENVELIANIDQSTKSPYTAVGYNLAAVKAKDKFDITPLIIGSQGSLGIITEATLGVVGYNPATTLVLVSLNRLEDLALILPKILLLKPSVFDFINKATMEQIAKLNPRQLEGSLDVPGAAVHLFIEFDEAKDSARKRCAKAVSKLVEKIEGYYQIADSFESQQRLWKLRHATATLLLQPDEQRKAVPVAENVSVPPERLVDFLTEADKTFTADMLAPAMWGHAGSGIVRMHPHLDLSQVGDRQKFFKLSDSLYKLAVSLGGNISSGGDGRVRAPYVRAIYGHPFHDLMLKVKTIFDPHNMLNPGVKTAQSPDIKAMMRTEYSLARYHEHLPRS